MEEVSRQALNAIPSVMSIDTSGRPSSGRLYDTSTRSLGDSKPQGVCYTKLTRGDCTKPGCAFSHSSDAILRELTKLMTSWKGGTFTQTPPKNRMGPDLVEGCTAIAPLCRPVGRNQAQETLFDDNMTSDVRRKSHLSFSILRQ